MDDKKSLEKAIQLSLTAASQKPRPDFEPKKEEKKEEYRSKDIKNDRGRSKSKEKKKAKSKPKIEEKSGPLKDLVIAFTGEFEDYNKEEVIEVCMQLGADCPKSLTRKCNLLIQGSFVMDHFKRKQSTPVS